MKTPAMHCIVGLCLLVSMPYLWAATAPVLEMPQIDPAQSKAHLQVERLDASRTHVRLNNPEISVREHWLDYQRLSSFAIEGEALLPAEDRPALPQVSRLYQIPNTGQVHVELGAVEYDVVDNIDVLPLKLETPAFGQLSRDGQVYNKDDWYPREIAVLEKPAVFRDLRVAQLVLYPVQVNPVTRQARIYRNLEAEIVATDEPGENELRESRPVLASYLPVYRRLVPNLDEDWLTHVSSVPGSYLIICTTDSLSVRRYVDSLFVWKTRKGHRVGIDARSNWTGTTIKSAIQVAYDTWDPPLEFVCLIGDPAVSGLGVPLFSNIEYDHGYALLGGDDHIEDIGIGRLSASDGGELAVVNAKIMAYERDPYMADTGWFTRAFCYAGISSQIASNPVLMQWIAQQFAAWTGVVNTTVAVYPDVANEVLVRQQFAAGISFFLWRGTFVSQMSNTLAYTTAPGRQLPICMCVTCGANDYGTDLGTAESYLVAANSVNDLRGGVAAVGTATATTHTPPNTTFFGGTIYAIVNLGLEHLGHAVSAGKVWLGMAYGWGGVGYESAINFSRWNNIMGDPGLSMWTDVPTVMTAVHPAALNVGARSVTVNVRRSGDDAPVKDALVVLWKRNPDSTWVRGRTDDQGQITLPVHVRAPGDMFVTVTKQNHKPYLATIPCDRGAQMVMYSTYRLDDDRVNGTNGNGNGRIEPGEIIDLPIYVRNFGTTSVTGISATLTTANSHVTITRPLATYPNLAPGDSALAAVPFRLDASLAVQYGESVELTLALSTDSGAVSGNITFIAEGVNLAYQSYTMDASLNPGDTRTLGVTLQNMSAWRLMGATALLKSRSPFVRVFSPAVNLGNVEPNASVTTPLFTIYADSSTYRGFHAPMLLIVSNSAGACDSVAFNLKFAIAEITDPIGPDGYGYYAYENTDTDYALHPFYNFVDISAAPGNNLNLSDPGEMNQPDQVFTAVQRLPFAFKFYGQVYDTVTICSNGWIAFGDQRWNTAFRNYHIPAMQAPQAMIAPYWQDLCTSDANMGVWSCFQPDSHRYIVQWKAGQISGSGEICNSQSLNFEVILYDTGSYPTRDGNGKILMQYQMVTASPSDAINEIPGFGVGIQDRRGTTGLAVYNHPEYTLGSAPLVAGRAILFTTEARRLCGNLAGQVTDAATGVPVPQAVVSISDYGHSDTTDSAGYYSFSELPAGDHSLTVNHSGHNSFHQENLYIASDTTVTLNIALLHPEMVLSADSLCLHAVTGDSATATFTLANPGNGPLDASAAILFGGDPHVAPLDIVATLPLSQLTDDWQIQGCEFAGGRWWVTGGSGSGGQNVIYKFDLDGNLCGQIPQPSTTSIGWFDMAWDGHLLWGSDGQYLIGIDTLGNVVDSIPSPMNPSRAVAFDPQLRHFWVTDYTQDIYEIDSTGNTVHQFANAGSGELWITGLAWNGEDQEGYKLYLISQDGASHAQLSRLDPGSGQKTTPVDLPVAPEDRAAGLTVTTDWNSTLLVCGTVIQSSNGDFLQVHELAFDDTWITVSPLSVHIAAGESQEIAVILDAQNLAYDHVYRTDIRFFSEVMDSSVVMPVILQVGLTDADDAVVTLPTEYRLHQNYPNPFNPTTTICYELKTDGLTRLRVYNLMGQQVAEPVHARQGAGVYQVSFDASNLPSGMYFYRLESGDFIKTQKMVLMK